MLVRAAALECAYSERQMAGILNKTTDSDFQDVSEKIIEVLHSQILGFSQLSSILNQEKNREGELNDGEIVKSLDNLVKGGRICSREINSQASKKTISIYWLTSRQKPVCNSSPVSQAKISTVETVIFTTPKSNSRLRSRSGRYHSPSMQFVSPVLKRPCDKDHEGNMSTPKRTRFDKDDEILVSSPQSAIQGCSEDRQLLMKKRDLKKRIQDKEDLLHKLNLVKIHRVKNDLKELQVLIDKWRNVSQDAAERLLSKIQYEPKPTMGQLLSSLQVDNQLIHYCENDEGFY